MKAAGDDTGNRKLLLDAAQQLMLEEGYGAVTTRRVAAKAGLKPQLVHYYFESMDQLLLELLRRVTAHSRERLAHALEAPEPLRALWELSTNRDITALTVEMMALANHRKAIRAELAANAKYLRRTQVESLSKLFEQMGIVDDVVRPDAVMVVITSLAQSLVMEKSLGITTGHRNTRAMMEHFLTQLDLRARSSTVAPCVQTERSR
jgi:AcrR family transcriptional regulator